MESLLYRYTYWAHSEYVVTIYCLAWLTSLACLQISWLQLNFQYNEMCMKMYVLKGLMIKAKQMASINMASLHLWDIFIAHYQNQWLKTHFVLSLSMPMVDISILPVACGGFVSDDTVPPRKWWEAACLTNTTQVTCKKLVLFLLTDLACSINS